jgi:hypothetical protein
MFENTGLGPPSHGSSRLLRLSSLDFAPPGFIRMLALRRRTSAADRIAHGSPIELRPEDFQPTL